MSTKSAKKVNRVWKAVVLLTAAAVAYVAMSENPFHFVTMGIILAYGLDSEIVKPDPLDDII